MFEHIDGIGTFLAWSATAGLERSVARSKLREMRAAASCRTPKLACVIVVLLLSASAAHAQTTVAIKGGTVLTMAGPAIENGTVLIRDRKIAAVGTSVEIPAGAAIIDATGKYVMPGLVDAMTYYGIRPFATNDLSSPVTPQNRIIEAYYPFGEFMRGKGGIERDVELLEGGVTTIYIAPGSRQVIGGQGAVVKTNGRDYDSMIVREPAAIDMTIGDIAKTSPANPPRAGIAALIRKTLVEAQEFDRALLNFNRKSEEEKKTAQEPKRDPAKEAIVKLLHRQVPARIEAEALGDILAAIRIKDEFGIDVTIDGGVGAWKARDMLAQKKISVVLAPTSYPYLSNYGVSWIPELYNETNDYNAALLLKAGVIIAVGSFGSGNGFEGRGYQGRWLLLEAGLLTAYGLSEQDALKTVTINAAKILGVDGRVGSLEAGKDADVIVLDGPPTRIRTWVERVYMDGAPVYVREKDVPAERDLLR